MIISLFLFFSAHFSTAEVTRSSTSLATGGAGVAAVDAGEATFSNPASITHMRGRYFFSSIQKDSMAISLLENDPRSAKPGSIGYESWKELEAFNISLAEQAFRGFSFGLSLKYFQLKPKDREQKRSSQINGNLGLTWAISRQFGLGAAFENVAEINREFSETTDLQPRTRVGMNYIYKEWFRARLDFMTHENNSYDVWIPQVGFESYFGRWVIGRLGWYREPQYSDSWTGGLGLALPRFRIDYAYQSISSQKNETRHSVDLGVPF